jgi:hypothetical protein
MPAFEVEIDFEVYCDTCGEGLCNKSTATETRTRNARSVRVEVCHKCIAEKDKEIEQLQETILELRKELNQ